MKRETRDPIREGEKPYLLPDPALVWESPSKADFICSTLGQIFQELLLRLKESWCTPFYTFFYPYILRWAKKEPKIFLPKKKRPSFSFFLIGGAVRQFPCSAEVSALPHTSPRSRYSPLPPPLSSPLHFIFHEKKGSEKKT